MTTECPKCHTNNPDDSKFCKECATPFPGAGGAVPTRTLETSIKGFAERDPLGDGWSEDGRIVSTTGPILSEIGSQILA